ncbi:MAG: NifB/NifX family molybdenum-iron cluster-binding protein [Bacteroidales bacterium]
MMKIAVPSDDRIHISGHFGRAKGFLIVQTDRDKIVSKEYVQNTFTGHARGMHHEHGDDHDHHHHHHAHGHGHHSHAGIFEALGDCEVVIAGGMGRRLYDEFVERNIKVFVTREKDVEEAVRLFLAEQLDHDSEGCCH